jgi:5-methyltetrahydrofolate--homocysteine methyltransferase
MDLGPLRAAIESGDRPTAIRLTSEAIAQGTDPAAILGAMTAAMATVGDRFSANEIYVPEMLISARAMKAAVALLEPLLVDVGVRPDTTAVIGVVKGNLHDIGKNLVSMMWKGANIAVVDLGTDVTPDRFVDAARTHGARVVGVSALLTTTMTGMRDVVSAVRAAGLHDVKVVVGGAPVTAEFAAEIGADGYAATAPAAVELVKRLIRSRV